jgi:hypothetical protein
MTYPTTVVSGYWACTNKHGTKFAHFCDEALYKTPTFMSRTSWQRRIKRGMQFHGAVFRTNVYFQVHGSNAVALVTLGDQPTLATSEKD